ncbi:MAG TPA: molybdate ABC transporter substrate-binding protein [Desulfobacteraceae bacterium]|nr:molybdate ABC transporter substrate-binding protein [Desulfobacteraceae bacterium]
MKLSIYLKKYKIILIILLACFVSSTVFAKKKPKELLVFAGAGMRMPLNEIGEKFKKLYGITVLYDYEGSGRLGNKILAGQVPDVFIPGSDRWAGILKEKGYINDYFPIACHIPVIITPEKNIKINSLGDFINKKNRIVLGDVKACAIGRISAAIFKKAGFEKSGMNVIARGVSVKQLVLWIEGYNADAGIVWKADALQSGRIRIIDIQKQYNVTSIIPVCQMLKDKKAVKEYIHYLLNIEGKKIFKKYGFDLVE